mmetsp:Transcript_26242/g.75740  ORF Transcript_26242/g.75740 Transcript_26242/m.75740 type:complete len:83 (-) Transcript_26242:1527-1775(-)
MMRSAFRTVDNLWAITICVRRDLWSINAFSARCTTASDSASRADVASSRSKIVGLAIIARAIATRCFCPPESLMPRSPTKVS